MCVNIILKSMKWIYTLLAVALGASMVIKSAWFVQSFGRSSWAEQHLGGGGTYTMYKLLGIVIIIVSLFIATGVMGEILIGTLGQLFGL